MDWSELPFDGIVRAVTVDQDRLVAVGGHAGERHAWTSTNGVSWSGQSVPGPSTDHCLPEEPVCIERSAAMGPMVRLHDTLYSFGATEFFNDYIKAVGWRWTDGQDRWQVIESDSVIYAGGAFRAAATSDSAIFAVTHAGYPLTERHWLWTADTSWEEVGDEISLENPIEYRSVAWRDGRFLAAGAVLDVEAEQNQFGWPSSPALWTSSDGRDWTALAPPDDADSLCSVTAVGEAFMLLGVTDGRPATWRSLDGGSWEAGTLAGSSPDVGCAGNVVQLPDGLLAYVVAADQTLTWTSTDGVTWTPGATLDIRTGPSLVAALGDTVVAMGSRGALESELPTVLMVGKPSP